MWSGGWGGGAHGREGAGDGAADGAEDGHAARVLEDAEPDAEGEEGAEAALDADARRRAVELGKVAAKRVGAVGHDLGVKVCEGVDVVDAQADDGERGGHHEHGHPEERIAAQRGRPRQSDSRQTGGLKRPRVDAPNTTQRHCRGVAVVVIHAVCPGTVVGDNGGDHMTLREGVADQLLLEQGGRASGARGDRSRVSAMAP